MGERTRPRHPRFSSNSNNNNRNNNNNNRRRPNGRNNPLFSRRKDLKVKQKSRLVSSEKTPLCREVEMEEEEKEAEVEEEEEEVVQKGWVQPVESSTMEEFSR